MMLQKHDKFTHMSDDEMREADGGLILTATLIVASAFVKKAATTKAITTAVSITAPVETIIVLNRVFN